MNEATVATPSEPGRHVPLPQVRRRRGRVPRGRAAGAARPDLPEPRADAGVRRSRRPDEADADDGFASAEERDTKMKYGVEEGALRCGSGDEQLAHAGDTSRPNN